MKRLLSLMVVCLIAAAGCSSNDDTDNGDGTTAVGIKIQGTATSGSGSVNVLPKALLSKAAPEGCPADEDGVAINLTPVDGSFIIAPKYIHLLKEGGSDYYSIPACEHSTAVEAETNAVTLSSSATTICELDETIPEEALATYDGIEMALYYIQMTVPMIVPQISSDEANYKLRMYFNDNDTNGILARDILIYNETDAKWGWVSWDNEGSLAYVEDGRPMGLLDAFSNDAFWCADCAANPELCPETNKRQCSAEHADWSYKDPVIISTRDTGDYISGSDFRMSGSFIIASASEAHTISMAFDVVGTLTAWESLDDLSDTERTLNVMEDCGFHPLFPSVQVTEAKE